jgi:hypothetical protein
MKHTYLVAVLVFSCLSVGSAQQRTSSGASEAARHGAGTAARGAAVGTANRAVGAGTAATRGAVGTANRALGAGTAARGAAVGTANRAMVGAGTAAKGAAGGTAIHRGGIAGGVTHSKQR